MADDTTLGPVARRLAATQRVMCIEDEADIALFLRAYFRASGFDLVHVDPDSVDDAMAALDEHRPDVVLLDIRLRGFSGRDVYRRMRTDERWAFTPVVMVSADPDPRLRKAQGLDAFVAKPFNTNTLADIVRNRLAVGEELAATGRHQRLQLMTQRYLEARLSDEIGLAGRDGWFSFALVRLLTRDQVVQEVGRDGLDHVVTQLTDCIQDGLPAEVVIGLSDADEIAVILPGHDTSAADGVLSPVLDSVSGAFSFPGGATVPIRTAAGLASYPAHAASPDELFMAADAALADAVDGGQLTARAL